MIMRLLWVAVVVLLPGLAQAAGKLELTGDFTQGGMVKGQTEPGAEVSLNGRSLRVDRWGRFVFGFGRDEAAEAILTVRYGDGAVEERALQIAQRSYDIQRIDGLPQTMVTPKPELLDRIRREGAQIAEARRRDTDAAWFWDGFIRPAEGPLTGVYGSQRILNGEPRQPHFGLDFGGPKGSPVVAPAPGIVVLAEPDHYYTGKTVLIDHGHGVNSVLMHLDRIDVEPGQRVEAGEMIGAIGASGRATGPHLDWRVNWFEVRLDPAFLIGEGGK